jgi:hypothetical protein
LQVHFKGSSAISDKLLRKTSFCAPRRWASRSHGCPPLGSRCPQFSLSSPLYKAKLLRSDKPPVGDPHPIERSVEIGRPEHELRKVRSHVIVLPDAADLIPRGVNFFDA